MKRKSIKKSLERRRRLNRSRRLKAAAVTLGLATAWGNAGADAATINSTATVTLSVSDATAFSISDGNGATATATATITIEGLVAPPGGGNSGLSTISNLPFDLSADDGYFLVGVAGQDLVLSFPEGGASAIGEFWGSLFIDPVRGGVTEGEILQQLASGSFAAGETLDPKSPLGLLVGEYADLLRTPLGEESTLVAFTNNAAGINNGEFAGVFTQSIVPEPMSAAMLISGAGLVLAVRRRG